MDWGQIQASNVGWALAQQVRAAVHFGFSFIKKQSHNDNNVAKKYRFAGLLGQGPTYN